MKFAQSIALLTAFVVPALSAATAIVNVPLTYDTRYDDPSGRISSTVCSEKLAQYPTFGSLPSFPYIAGASYVEGFNSTQCGTCWSLTYLKDGKVNGIYVTAINSAPNGFTSSLTAETTLTGFNRNNIPRDVIIGAEQVFEDY
ncbi:allergen Asp f 15 precursor, partial [Crucibulum laeve]